MVEYKFSELPLKGAYLIECTSYKDRRGKFAKFFERNMYETAGIRFQVNETFISISKINVIRGLHFQIKCPQAKLVSVCTGKVWDVIVDLRLDSPTYSKWVGIEMSSADYKSIFIPKGFAHGFLALEEDTVMLYQCDGVYNKESDSGIIFNDPDIGIKWPLEEQMSIHSERDLSLMSLKQYEELMKKF